MTFEEEFPSLKDKLLTYGRTEEYGDLNETCYEWSSEKEIHIDIKDVQECCLDKERVKQVIYKIVPGMMMNHAENCDCVGCNLLKELELN